MHYFCGLGLLHSEIKAIKYSQMDLKKNPCPKHLPPERASCFGAINAICRCCPMNALPARVPAARLRSLRQEISGSARKGEEISSQSSSMRSTAVQIFWRAE